MDFVLYALCKKYVKKTAVGLGAVIGAPCTIKSITLSPDNKTNIVTFEWTGTDGSKKTSTMNVKNGTITEVTPLLDSGVKIATVTVDGVSTDIYAPEGGGTVGVELTQAEYDALSEEEKLNGTVYFITDGHGGGGGGSAELENPMTATKAVGGVSVGKTWNIGTPLEQILRDILSPVLYPTLTAPSASLSVPGTTLLEHGTVISKTLTCSFSQGSISPAYGTNGKRSGPAGTYSLNGGDPQSGNTFTETVSESNKTFRVNVTYSEGPQPKDSAGNNYSSPLPAGNVNSNTITYDFTYAIWSNAASSTSIAKMDLVKQSAKQRIINFGACAETNPEALDIPTAWGLTAIEVKNDLTGNYDECTDEFVSSSVVHKDAAGVDVNYTRYTCNLGYDMGPREIRIKWS